MTVPSVASSVERAGGGGASRKLGRFSNESAALRAASAPVPMTGSAIAATTRPSAPLANTKRRNAWSERPGRGGALGAGRFFADPAMDGWYVRPLGPTVLLWPGGVAVQAVSNGGKSVRERGDRVNARLLL